MIFEKMQLYYNQELLDLHDFSRFDVLILSSLLQYYRCLLIITITETYDDKQDDPFLSLLVNFKEKIM